MTGQELTSFKTDSKFVSEFSPLLVAAMEGNHNSYNTTQLQCVLVNITRKLLRASLRKLVLLKLMPQK